jgi:MFS family permease
MNPEAAPVTTASRSLWRHADFMKIWTAATVSLMGSQVSQFAIPIIAAVILKATPFEVALLGAFEMLPFILFALPAGAWLDRVRRRPVLIGGDFGRAIALVTIPIAYALGFLTIWQLYAVGFVAGLLTVLFDVADQSYLPALIDREDLVEGNAKLSISGAAAQLLGPGFAGNLIQLVAAPFAILIDAASFLISGLLIGLIRKEEPTPERAVDETGRHASLRQDIAEGLRYVLGNRYLRMIAGSTATSNLGSSIAFATFAIFAYRELKLDFGLVGTAMSLGALGVLVGSFIATPLAKRIGVGASIIGAMFLSGPSTLLLSTLPADQIPTGAIIFASTFLGGITAIVYNVNQVSFRQAITPLAIQGRMNATMRFIVWGTLPLGAVIGGVLASFLPIRTTVMIGGLVACTAFLWVLASPVRSLREIPKPE